MVLHSLQRGMASPLLRKGVVLAGTAAGVALVDPDRRDAVRGVTSGALRFTSAFSNASIVSLDFKYRYVCSIHEEWGVKIKGGVPAGARGARWMLLRYRRRFKCSVIVSGCLHVSARLYVVVSVAFAHYTGKTVKLRCPALGVC